MSTGEIASTYSSVIISDDGIPITAKKLAASVKAAKVDNVKSKPAEKCNIDDLILDVGAGGGAAVAAAVPAGGAAAAAAPPPEEKKEETKE